MYIIEKIENEQGERTDGRYPFRKGCIGNIYHLHIGQCFVFEYTADNQGNSKSGYLRTSAVVGFDWSDEGIIIYTLNSIYTLREIKQETKLT